MSLKGTGTLTPRWFACSTDCTSARHCAGTTGTSDWFSPEGRQKFDTAAGTNGPAGPTPQAATEIGNVLGVTAPAATAPRQSLHSRSPRVGLALIGRSVRWPQLEAQLGRRE